MPIYADHIPNTYQFLRNSPRIKSSPVSGSGIKLAEAAALRVAGRGAKLTDLCSVDQLPNGNKKTTAAIAEANCPMTVHCYQSAGPGAPDLADLRGGATLIANNREACSCSASMPESLSRQNKIIEITTYLAQQRRKENLKSGCRVLTSLLRVR